MTGRLARVPPPSHPPATARTWCATTGAAALAAIVLLALHTNRLIIAAGVLAAAAAGTALFTAWLRSRRANSADITVISAVTLILAVPLLVLLDIIKAHQPTRSRAGASPHRPPAPARAAARSTTAYGWQLRHAACGPGLPPDAAFE
jgi:hypothetical protein